MNFDVMGVITSYPQCEVNHNVEWIAVNYVFRYDAAMVLNV